MSRAKRIEEAARALEAAEGPLGPEPGCECAVCTARRSLRRALSLPEDESEVGYVLRYQNDTLLDACSDGISELPLVRPRTSKLVRVRITVEGEESER